MEGHHVDERAKLVAAVGGQLKATLSEETFQALRSHASGRVTVYDESVHQREAVVYALARIGGEKRLIVAGSASAGFEEETLLETDGGERLALCALTPADPKALHEVYGWTAPQPLGKVSAIGCGDRLGLATLGHLRACRGAGARPVLAWGALESGPDETLRRYAEEAPETAEALGVQFGEEALKRAAVKYGAATAHTKMMAGNFSSPLLILCS